MNDKSASSTFSLQESSAMEDGGYARWWGANHTETWSTNVASQCGRIEASFFFEGRPPQSWLAKRRETSCPNPSGTISASFGVVPAASLVSSSYVGSVLTSGCEANDGSKCEFATTKPPRYLQLTRPAISQCRPCYFSPFLCCCFCALALC